MVQEIPKTSFEVTLDQSSVIAAEPTKSIQCDLYDNTSSEQTALDVYEMGLHVHRKTSEEPHEIDLRHVHVCIRSTIMQVFILSEIGELFTCSSLTPQVAI